jgi:hypothetical protein
MEFDAVHECVVADWPGVRGAGPQRLAIWLAAAAHVSARDRRERQKLNRGHLDDCSCDRVAPADTHLRAPPEPDRDRDAAGGNLITQVGAELHAFNATTPPSRNASTTHAAVLSDAVTDYPDPQVTAVRLAVPRANARERSRSSICVEFV